ncbi:MAG: 4Fe-4S binding protein [Clostridiales Family XIII bacterium]|jgi:epoxyqueuosine reductase QueG|nr:4Fe-4S binding protein [Clostridiales Family XIII bacterium]
MEKDEIQKLARAYITVSAYNFISKDAALRPELAGMRVLDEPIFAFASADNEVLTSLKDNPEARIKMEPPKYWLPEAQTVIAFFFPYSERIRISNRGGGWPSDEWKHARIEGDASALQFANSLKDALIAEGYEAVVPTCDDRFRYFEEIQADGKKAFSSNWSERHAGYAAGLGTFSLSRGLITEKGVAGTFFSVITSLLFEPTVPTYTGLTDNCTMCGKCAKNCPVKAIDLLTGKAYEPCSDFLHKNLEERPPYYGCGKCYVNVPCESRNPARKQG